MSVEVFDSHLAEMASSIAKDAEWANAYYSHFHSTNEFCRKNQTERLDENAEQFLKVVLTSLHRTAALSICRIWDKGSADRRCLVGLSAIPEFQVAAKSRDDTFVGDCRRFRESELCRKLFQFRDSDLAHSLNPSIRALESITFREFDEVLIATNNIVDRLVLLADLRRASLSDFVSTKIEDCSSFWKAVERSIVQSEPEAV